MDAPKVKEYFDSFQFLKDFYLHKKNLNPHFSYQSWSNQLGVKSKSYLRFVVNGQRKVSSQLLTKLTSYFEFNESDRKYFIILVQYTQTEEAESKKVFSRQMSELIKADQKLDVKDTMPIHNNPLFFHVRDLISCQDVPHTLSTISQTFKKTEEEMRDILRELASMNLAICNENQTWSATSECIRIPDNPKNHNLYQYHKQSLLMAIETIENEDLLRKFRSLNLVLSETEFKELNDKIYIFLNQIFNEYSDSSSALGKKIYQLNYNLSPRSEIISD